MLALLRCVSRPCHKDDTGISTKNKSPSLSVTYKGYKECTFGIVKIFDNGVKLLGTGKIEKVQYAHM